MFVPAKKNTYGPPWHVTEMTSLFYMYLVVVPSRKHAYGPPWPVYRDNFAFLYVPVGLHGLLRGQLYFLYVDDRTSQETRLWASTAWYRDSVAFCTNV
jgi:hypothetical protein